MKLRLGRVAGIAINVHWSFWLLPAWIVLSADGGLVNALVSVGFVFSIFGCVVLHELGHALMARHFGVGTRDITLYPIGGVASLDRMPKRPLHELAIAVAGPAVNVVIAAVLFAIILVAGIGTQGMIFNFTGGSLLFNLFVVNVMLVLFNMLPAFPMDGGRVLRAILAIRMSHLKATQIAVRFGQGVAIVFAMIGFFTGGTLIFIALFVFVVAQRELTMARRQAVYDASPFKIQTAQTYQAQTHQAQTHQARTYQAQTHQAEPTVRAPSDVVIWVDLESLEQVRRS